MNEEIQKEAMAAEANEEHPDSKAVMELALNAGHILLENGAEISRVEETMDRICRAYGVRSCNAFVLSNGIFMTAGSDAEPYYAKVQHIPVSSTHLNKVAAVNQLSREIEEGRYTAAQALQALDQIIRMPGKRKGMQILASGVGSAAFCYLFGGNLRDSLCAFATGLLLYLFVLSVSSTHLSKIVGNICGGMLVTSVCSLMYLTGIGEHLNFMIIGSIMPLVPGVPFTNAIREIADGDYISGSVRMLDTLLVFFCIATGVGIGIAFFRWMTGGVML
jgi:uncharacterized membrane protein YjjP (DUF1212 family)